MVKKFLKNLKLGTKLNLLLLLIFAVIVTSSGLVLSALLENKAEREVAAQAFLMMETMESVREYTDTQVNPELAPRLMTEDWFIPQAIPTYSVREVFENLRQREAFGEFFYKDAVLNPTNPRDQADDFETQLIENFKQQPELSQLNGFHYQPSGMLFYVARPLTISSESCLQCHSTPEAAPKSQLATYGTEGGFGWQLNEIIGTQVIFVPASTVFAAARQLQVWVIGILIGFFLLAVLLLNLFLKMAVTNPIVEMAHLSKKVSTGDMSGEFKHNSNDEIGMLAASLNRLKISLQMAMDMISDD